MTSIAYSTLVLNQEARQINDTSSHVTLQLIWNKNVRPEQ